MSMHSLLIVASLYQIYLEVFSVVHHKEKRPHQEQHLLHFHLCNGETEFNMQLETCRICVYTFASSRVDIFKCL